MSLNKFSAYSRQTFLHSSIIALTKFKQTKVGNGMTIKNTKLKIVSSIIAMCLSQSAFADISTNAVTLKEVRPLDSGTSIVIAASTPAALCGGKTNFFIRNSDTHNGKALYAAALTAMAAGMSVKPQVDAANCGQVWPDRDW